MYTPADAIKTPVRIALQNGKSFKAAVLDVVDEGEGLHIIRLPSMRKEVLRFGANLGDINAVAPLQGQVKNITKDIKNEGFQKFKESQARYFKERDEQRIVLNNKIKEFEASKKRVVAELPQKPCESRVFDPIKFQYISERVECNV